MRNNLLKLLLGLLIAGLFTQLNAQNVVTFNVNSKKQMINNLESWSEVNMWHSNMTPDPYDLVKNLNSHNYTMCLKSDIEQVNDNNDPYVTDFSKFSVNTSGKSGNPMSNFFPFIRECKRISDSMRAVNPALKPFSLGLRAGVYNRYVPEWMATSAAGTGQVDPNMYAEWAENIYMQCKLYKDNTGVDVTFIDPLANIFVNPLNNITPDNLRRMLDTLGVYLDKRGFHPMLGFGNSLTNSYYTGTLHFDYITQVFNDPIAKKYVKNVNVEYSMMWGTPSNAYYNQLVDSSKKYGFEITTTYGVYNSPLDAGYWKWPGNELNFAKSLPSVLNTLQSNNIQIVFHSNWELGFDICMRYDTIPNQMDPPYIGLDDMRRKTTSNKTGAYYLLRHLFRHTNAGSTYVVTSSSTNANILQVVLIDTVTSKTTILLVNQSSGALTATLNSGSYNPGTYDVYRCSANEKDVHLAFISSTATISLPAQSATILTTDYTITDTQAPSVPSNLTSSNITSNSFTLSWAASTDNVGVTGYEVFKNGVSIGTTPTTSMSVTGLTCNTSFSMTVRARDAAPNWSAQSTASAISTSACISVTGVSVAPTTLSVKLGNSPTIVATATPANASNKTIIWSSGNTGIATVDATGKVTTVAVGNTNIIATTQDGNYTASCALTVTSNTAPIAVMGATPVSGSAPLQVSFSSAGSSDPDGGDVISAYDWDFGDGSPNETVNNPIHIYSTGGTYTARLRVMDNNNLYSSWATQTITVTSPTNIALIGTGYRWYGNTVSTDNTNAVVANGINDNNSTTDIFLMGGNSDSPTGDFLGAWEAAGITWSSAQNNITRVQFINGSYGGSVTDNGCFDANFKLQLSADGTTWTDATGWTLSPAYQYDNAAVSGATFTFSGSESNIRGVRITGQVHVIEGQYSYEVRCREVKVLTDASSIINSQIEKSISVYPTLVVNPSHINIEAEIGNIISIVNISGVELFSTVMNADLITIDTDNFPKGICLVYIKTADKIVVVKCVIM